MRETKLVDALRQVIPTSDTKTLFLFHWEIWVRWESYSGDPLPKAPPLGERLHSLSNTREIRNSSDRFV